MKNLSSLSSLSLVELIALYNNYVLVKSSNCGSAWSLLDETKIEFVRHEIETRLNSVDFYAE